MTDHELNLCPILDIIVSHTLAFLKYEPSIVDFSITLGGGQYGVAFALYDPVAFTAHFGTTPQPLLHPWDAHGNAQQIANWSARLRKYNVQEDEHLPKLRTVILMVPQEVLEPLKDEYGSLVMWSTADIMTRTCGVWDFNSRRFGFFDAPTQYQVRAQQSFAGICGPVERHVS